MQRRTQNASVAVALAVVATTACGGSTQRPGAGKPGDRLPVSGAACQIVETVVSSEHADVKSEIPPNTVWTGSEYKVFWHDFRTTTSSNDFWSPGTYVAAVDAEGRSQPERHVSYDWFESTVWTGNGFAVALHGTFRSASNQDLQGIYFWRLDAGETPLGEPVLVKEDASWSVYDGSILVSTGEGFGAAWGGNTASFARLDSTGQKLSETSFDSESLKYVPELVSTAGGFALSWSGGSGETYFQELDSSGTPRSPMVKIAGGGGWIASRPHLTWLGDGYVMLWTEASQGQSRLRVSRVDRSGSVVGSSSQWLGGPARFVSIGSETVVLVNDDQGQTLLARFDGSGALQSAQRVAAELEWQGLGELTHGPGQYAVSFISNSVDDDRVVLLQIECP